MRPIGQALSLVLALGMLAIPASASAAVLGSWDLVRGGAYSLSEGSNTATARALLPAIFPGLTLTGTSKLTPEYLDTVDAMIVTSVVTDIAPIVPLSSDEQTALLNYVLSGGNVALLGERSGLADAANTSMFSPFGLTLSGELFGHLMATVPNPAANPITSTPAGETPALETINPGWFTVLGIAQPLAFLDINGQPILAVIPEGALGPGSGRVVLAADSDIFTENLALTINTVAYLAPEPSTGMLLAAGALSLLAASFLRSRGQAVARDTLDCREIVPGAFVSCDWVTPRARSEGLRIGAP